MAEEPRRHRFVSLFGAFPFILKVTRFYRPVKYFLIVNTSKPSCSPRPKNVYVALFLAEVRPTCSQIPGIAWAVQISR